MQIQKILQQPTMTSSESSQNGNTSKITSDTQLTNLDDETDSTDLDDEIDSTDQEEDYFLIRIDSNLQDSLSVDRLNNYGLNLSQKEIRVSNISEKIKHKALLFDRKGGFVRIWGYSDMMYSSRQTYNAPNLKIINFIPVNSPVNVQVKPKWIPEELSRPSMFTNKKIIKAVKTDYENILRTCVPSHELFKSSDDISLEENQQDIQYDDDTPLEIPNKTTLDAGMNKIADELLIDKKIIQEIVINLASGRNVLLAGPIGTGKTRLASMIPEYFWHIDDKDLGYKTELYTASYEWNVTDVIGGIVPRMRGDKPTYKIQYGCVADTVKKCWNDKMSKNNSNGVYRGTWLVIDEFNRAEIDKAFGQLFTSLESKKLRIPNETTPELNEIKIPKDYRIIGTLNTSDKHYLFKLSDALKRRFAYIEVKSPTKNESDKEIFYALNNALKELSSERFSSMVNLDMTERKLSSTQTNPEFVSAIRTAYEILSFVRVIKDMGTAVLKSIYQTMLVGTQIQGYTDDILDIALNGNIIPQLERISATSIEVISKFCFDDMHSFFRRMYDAPDEDIRQKYTHDFGYYLQFLGIPETENLKDKYSKKTIGTEIWATILEKWSAQKPNSLPRKLPLFNASLEDLKKTFELL